MPALVEYLEMAETEEKRALLRSQWSEAVEKRTVHCGCGRPRSLELAYRCLYCGIWFCVPCAEEHFSMTVRQWKVQKSRVRPGFEP